MRYYYEFKYRNGNINGGHNLEKITIQDDIVVLKGVDIIPTYYDDERHYWGININMNEIEYLKIEPMRGNIIDD